MTEDTFHDADPNEIVSIGGGTMVSLKRAVQGHIERVRAGANPMTMAFRDHGKEPSSFTPDQLEVLASRRGFEVV